MLPEKYKGLKGFYYEVTDEQIAQHQKRTVQQIFDCLESTNKFFYEIQTLQERERMFKIRRGEF